MVSGVSGSNLATSYRELDRITPPTQHEELAQNYRKASQTITQSRVDTVSISKEALAMAKGAEKADGEPSEAAGRPMNKTRQ